MKALLVIIVLGVGGYFGYNYFLPSEAIAEDAASSEVAGGTAASGFAAELAKAAGVEVVEAAPAAVAAVSADFSDALTKADAQWLALAANGNNPTTQAASIPLARAYTKILRGLLWPLAPEPSKIALSPSACNRWPIRCFLASPPIWMTGAVLLPLTRLNPVITSITSAEPTA